MTYEQLTQKANQIGILVNTDTNRAYINPHVKRLFWLSQLQFPFMCDDGYIMTYDMILQYLDLFVRSYNQMTNTEKVVFDSVFNIMKQISTNAQNNEQKNEQQNQ